MRVDRLTKQTGHDASDGRSELEETSDGIGVDELVLESEQDEIEKRVSKRAWTALWNLESPAGRPTREETSGKVDEKEGKDGKRGDLDPS